MTYLDEAKRRWVEACVKHLEAREPSMDPGDRQALAEALWERRSARKANPVAESGHARRATPDE